MSSELIRWAGGNIALYWGKILTGNVQTPSLWAKAKVAIKRLSF
jgi:hypothetical protein